MEAMFFICIKSLNRDIRGDIKRWKSMERQNIGAGDMCGLYIHISG